MFHEEALPYRLLLDNSEVLATVMGDSSCAGLLILVNGLLWLSTSSTTPIEYLIKGLHYNLYTHQHLGCYQRDITTIRDIYNYRALLASIYSCSDIGLQLQSLLGRPTYPAFINNCLRMDYEDGFISCHIFINQWALLTWFTCISKEADLHVLQLITSASFHFTGPPLLQYLLHLKERITKTCYPVCYCIASKASEFKLHPMTSVSQISGFAEIAIPDCSADRGNLIVSSCTYSLLFFAFFLVLVNSCFYSPIFCHCM